MPEICSSIFLVVDSLSAIYHAVAATEWLYKGKGRNPCSRRRFLRPFFIRDRMASANTSAQNMSALFRRRRPEISRKVRREPRISADRTSRHLQWGACKCRSIPPVMPDPIHSQKQRRFARG
jgi:hypothetical protein